MKINDQKAYGFRIQNDWVRKFYQCFLFCTTSLILLLLSGHASSSEKTPLQKQFESELEAFHEQYQFPGATAAYILPDGTTGVAAVGLADVENEIPMQPDSRMLAASIARSRGFANAGAA